MKVGGDFLKYLKRGWNRKKERGNKDLKKGGWDSLINYVCSPYIFNRVHNRRQSRMITELVLRVCDSWITNYFLDSTNQTFVKLLFFTNCFFQKMITLKYSAQMIPICYLSRVKWVRLNNQRTQFCELLCYILKLNIMKKFLTKQYFFLIPTLV